jgi:hypothetical protein
MLVAKSGLYLLSSESLPESGIKSRDESNKGSADQAMTRKERQLNQLFW